MTSQPYDLFIIGGGINGAGIARDAAGRGKRVFLCDKGDLGGGTSSASTKLIHGGLRYLEFYEFALVRKALAERERILAIAPHLSWPMPFVLPLGKDTRPSWMIRAGLFLYDHLARRRSFPDSEKIALADDPGGAVLQPKYRRAFRYWDGWVDDSRLVIANCRDAARRGAAIVPRDGASEARFADGLWQVTLDSGRTVAARCLVNCAGPWAEEVASTVLGRNDAPRLDLVQGAHIVVPRIGTGADAYMLQQPDGRIIFTIPYQREFTLIGTTETRIEQPSEAQITAEESRYLLDAANRYLRATLTPDDIRASFAGVRPLVLEEGKNARETSREWKLVEHDGVRATTVVGGKLTTYRLLAETVMERLYPGTRPWTGTAPLPGGDIPGADRAPPREAYRRWVAELAETNPDLPVERVEQLCERYGTEVENLLGTGLGRDFGALFEAEVQHMANEEWARSPEDVLWRRSKAGLTAAEELRTYLTDFFSAKYTAS
ncbi:glycerol-3-phosphate dehydrogenase [Pacificimonas flava]|uniref:Glycerol-3-phosphate dehydrogenase n=2 Tax=Pacificimonas TaxID=1960290 RepID=A0A219B9G9_9SPHN|nr:MULTISPECIES: glycerol-3-phosphate dehydrogenase [Pacificimonas]MBZ6379890.1 glycerol-3-phosphate dehydrogenase [Pacificimonas aurantium]OWV34418.1 glycerol-3-phosphate dehydrogenase [Pacificimonas flava]